MKKNSVKIKSILSYLSTITSWALFVILIFFAILLAYYYVSMRLYATKGEKYEPPFTIYTIVSPSMTPNINVYDVIINVKVDNPNDIKVGDVITFESTSSLTRGMTITHRVKEVSEVDGQMQYVTKGDNNAGPDLAPALYEKIIGKALFRIPGLGRIQMFVASKFGWLVVVVLPAIYIVLKDVLKLIRISKVKKKAEEENTKLIKKSETPEAMAALLALESDIDNLLKKMEDSSKPKD